MEAHAGVKALVTSRSALALHGEHVFRVPPLALPGRGGALPGEEVTRFDAVRLFIERAQAAQADFVVTPETAPVIAEVCRRLDGLPLAIELAAAWVRVLPPSALLERSASRLALLADGPRDAATRHQTLRAAIDWSYALLEQGEQSLFARLGVFVGGCSLDAAEAVLGDRGAEASRIDTAAAADTPAIHRPLDILHGLAALADKSLLRPQSEHEEPRFGMLDTIREYALERLAASGEAEALRRRHAGYFRLFAEQAEQALQGASQANWLARLEAEHDNLRAALEWSIRQGQALTGLRLAGALWRFWWIRGYHEEGRRWLAAVLKLPAPRRQAAPRQQRTAVSAAPALGEPSGVGGTADYRTARAKALFAVGILAQMQADEPAAGAAFEESLALGRALGDAERIGYALHGLARSAYRRGDVATMRRLAEESVARFREATDPWGEAFSLQVFADAVKRLGEGRLATALTERSLALWRRLGDRQRIATALDRVGAAAAAGGELDRARQLYEEALAIRRELGDRPNLAWSITYLADVARDAGDPVAAEALHGESLALRRDLRDRSGMAFTLHRLGLLALDQGDLAAARQRLAESLILAQDVGERPQLVAGLLGLAELARQCGDVSRALRLGGAARALLTTLGGGQTTGDISATARLVAAGGARLGARKAAETWAHGASMSLAEAVADALAPDDRTAQDEPSERQFHSAPGRSQRHGTVTTHGAAEQNPAPLTRREAEVAALVAHGRTNRQIARELSIAPGTANRHVANILRKLGAS